MKVLGWVVKSLRKPIKSLGIPPPPPVGLGLQILKETYQILKDPSSPPVGVGLQILKETYQILKDPPPVGLGNIVSNIVRRRRTTSSNIVRRCTRGPQKSFGDVVRC